MKVILFGATGMVGQGALRECLLDDDVTQVLSIGRNATGREHPKLREMVHKDLSNFSAISSQLEGYDACFFCAGITSAGLTEADYSRVTYEMPVAAAEILVRLNPGMTFVYVSGAGADSSERGRTMWARVKGKAENALQRLPFKAVYVLRPAAIQPMHGITSRTRSYRVLYAVLGPLFPLFKLLFPQYITTTERVGKAMLAVVRHGAPKKVLENGDINLLVEKEGAADAHRGQVVSH